MAALADWLRDLTFTCHVCGRERPDAAISVSKHDVSGKYNLPTGTMFENIRYCNDDPTCTARAKTLTLAEAFHVPMRPSVPTRR